MGEAKETKDEQPFSRQDGRSIDDLGRPPKTSAEANAKAMKHPKKNKGRWTNNITSSLAHLVEVFALDALSLHLHELVTHPDGPVLLQTYVGSQRQYR